MVVRGLADKVGRAHLIILAPVRIALGFFIPTENLLGKTLCRCLVVHAFFCRAGKIFVELKKFFVAYAFGDALCLER